MQDPETGYTPLHAAIDACGSVSEEGGKEGENDVDIERAKEVVRELFLSGAIWNDLDANNETPGCLAWRLGRKELYNLCVEAGVRAELLLGLMGGYEELDGSDDEDEGEDIEIIEIEDANGDAEIVAEVADTNGHSHSLAVGPAEEQEIKKDVNSEDYLKSTLKFTDTALLDSDANGVMMAWETDIMRKSVDLLLPELKPGARILNIGFGMGIIDRMFRDTKPLSHHIIEAHPAVLAKISEPSSDFGKDWEESAPPGGNFKIHAGKWQDIAPELLKEGELFDAIYFDTFGEDYAQLKLFFTEFVPGLLDSEGRFGFFNGLGADRRVCYDVYTKVAELDLCESFLLLLHLIWNIYDLK